MKSTYRTQIASDTIRDGLGAELLDDSGSVIAEVFRCDRDNTLTVSTFSKPVSVAALENLLAVAYSRLGSFEDGTSLQAHAQQIAQGDCLEPGLRFSFGIRLEDERKQDGRD